VTLNGTVRDTNDATSGNVSVPPRFSLGASYRTGKFQLAAETILQSWNDNTLPNATGSTRFAVGADRLADLSPGATGFDRWIFRLGAYYDATYYTVGGEQVVQGALTAGVGIPLTRVSGLNVGSVLDLAVELGSRGGTSNGRTRELFGKFYLQLSVDELWFQRGDDK
jgi:hypothetical protein